MRRTKCNRGCKVSRYIQAEHVIVFPALTSWAVCRTCPLQTQWTNRCCPKQQQFALKAVRSDWSAKWCLGIEMESVGSCLHIFWYISIISDTLMQRHVLSSCHKMSQSDRIMNHDRRLVLPGFSITCHWVNMAMLRFVRSYGSAFHQLQVPITESLV